MLFSQFIQICNQYADKPAIISTNQETVSFKKLSQSVHSQIHHVKCMGISTENRVAIILPSSIDFIINFWALMGINAIAVPIAPNSHPYEIQTLLTQTKTTYIITNHTIKESLKANRSLVFINPQPPSIIKESSNSPFDYTGDALIQFTSGSTGEPKAVCKSQALLSQDITQLIKAIPILSNDNILSVLPFHHGYGFTICLMASAWTGATLYLIDKIESSPILCQLTHIFDYLNKHPITIFPAVPYIYELMIEGGEPTRFPHLRYCFSAGNFLDSRILNCFLEKFNFPIHQLYGSTEAGIISLHTEKDQLESLGKPLQGVSVKINSTNTYPNTPSKTGEILIKGKSVISNYMDQSSPESFKDGYFHTGDIGYVDKSGRLYIIGRKKHYLDIGGYKINPIEIEAVINQHPNVSESVVISEKQLSTQIIKAIIVPISSDCEKHDIQSFYKKYLSPIKHPRKIEFRKSLPKNSLGKIQRNQL